MTQYSVPWRPRTEVAYGFFARILIALAKAAYFISAPFVRAFPGPILISAVVATCLGVFVHALIFAYVDTTILQGAANAGIAAPAVESASPSTWGYPPSVIGDLMAKDGGMLSGAAGLLKYLLWPVQFGFLRDLIIMGALFGLFQVIPVYTIWWERKVAGRIQSRLGPMRVGGWHGWSQSMADGIKLVFKEDIIPAQADAPLFRAAPFFAIIPSFLAFVALPFGATYVFRELDVALVFILAMLGIEVVGVIIAGWASNNKWSVYGAMREACQMVSYEIPMGMALLIPVVTVGSLSLQQIGEAQSGGWFHWLAFRNPFTFAAFVAYFIASLASCKRAPFDLPESESELVADFHTEYSGLRWSLFFFAEYAAMFVVCGLASILFLGAWHSPLPLAWGESLVAAMGMEQGDVFARLIKGVLFSGPIWFVLKCVFFLYVQLWVRWTLPRIRIDQVLYACVQVLLPLTMILLLGATLWTLGLQSGQRSQMFAFVAQIVMGLIGMGFTLMMPVIAAYGFYHRRSLPGSLAVDALPGSWRASPAGSGGRSERHAMKHARQLVGWSVIVAGVLLGMAPAALGADAAIDHTADVTETARQGGLLEALMFYTVALATAVSALGCCISRNIVRMAVWLFCALGSVALLYFLLAATFIGAIQLIVYAGGTLILLIFGVMLTSKSPWARLDTHPLELASAGLICTVLFAALVLVFAASFGQPVNDPRINEPFTGPLPGVPVHAIGESLITRYLIPFEVAGVLLMVVMVGAAHLARQEKR